MEQKDKFFRLFLFCGARRPFARFCGEKIPGTKGLIVIFNMSNVDESLIAFVEICAY